MILLHSGWAYVKYLSVRTASGSVPAELSSAEAQGRHGNLNEAMRESSGIDEFGRWSSEELLLRAAWFYYKDELTQDEIAKRLSVSRASVGRLLDRARRVGLVSIQLIPDTSNAFELSAELRRVFRLTEALVVPDHDREPGRPSRLNARVGLGGAQFLNTHLRPGGSSGWAGARPCLG